MEGGLINPPALIRSGAAEGVTSIKLQWCPPPEPSQGLRQGATPCCINSIRLRTSRSWALGPDRRLAAAGAFDFDLAEDFGRDWLTAMAGWAWNAPLVLA